MIAVLVISSLVAATPSQADPQITAPQLLSAPGELFGPDNYPPEALRHDEQGRTVARLEVNAAGAVTGCTVLSSSGSAALDRQTCASAMRARFQPARDERSRPVPASILLPVRWVLPAAVTWTFAAWSMSARMRIDAAGRISACIDEFTGPAPREDGGPCETFGGTLVSGTFVRRSGGKAEPRSMVTTIALVPGSVNPLPPPGKGQVPNHASMRLTVDPAGKVTSCRPLAAVGLFQTLPSLCGIEPGPFAPLPSDAAQVERIATMTVAISYGG